MSGWPDRQPPVVESQPSRPAVCEVCGSPAVTTGSKTLDATTYFNCGACGHIWHPGRSRIGDDRRRGWR